MAELMTPGGGTGRPGIGLRLQEALPVRRVVLVALGIGLAYGIGLGTYKTLTLSGTSHISGAIWRELIVLGVAQGAVYALIAIGYSLVYGILQMINFAHGEVFMAGAYSSFFVAASLDSSGFLNRNYVVALLILFAVSALVSMGVAILLERVAYRPLRNAPRLVPLITAIGASFFLQNTFRGFFGAGSRGYPVINKLQGTWKIAGIPILRAQVLVIVFAIVAFVGLSLFVARTKTGKSMRAVAEDKEIASLMGINVDRVIVITFAIGGILAGVAGVLYVLVFQQVRFDMGFIPGIKAFTAAVLGGIGSIGGAALGGLIIGLLESVGPILFLAGWGTVGHRIPSPFQLKDLIAFTILVLVLIYRPGGILGTGEPEKV